VRDRICFLAKLFGAGALDDTLLALSSSLPSFEADNFDET